MRRLGVILLVAGFLWLLAMQVQVSMRGGIRPVLRTQYNQLDAMAKPSYSREEVEEFIRNTAGDAFDAQPLFALPGAICFIGGLLALRRPRRKSPD